jgi:hypothetical protein
MMAMSPKMAVTMSISKKRRMEAKEKGTVSEERAEGLAENKREAAAGTEAHRGAAAKAYPELKKKGKK